MIQGTVVQVRDVAHGPLIFFFSRMHVDTNLHVAFCSIKTLSLTAH